MEDSKRGRINEKELKEVLKNEGNLRPVDVKVSADSNGTITQITVTYKPLDGPVNVPEFLIRK